jgi:sulfonate dioxygenase
MASLESRRHISPDSGYPITLHPHFNIKIVSHNPPDPPHVEITPPPDRALFADFKKRALLSVASRRDLTESIGTLLSNVQLSSFSKEQLDELALLVSERGVVFFRDQDLTTEQQVKLFEHYGELDKHPAQKGQRHVNIGASLDDFREVLNYTPWPQGDWHADTSFEINPPSYSLLRMEEAPDVGGDTQWVRTRQSKKKPSAKLI